MSADFSSELKAEIGHVLFVDIVGYSKLLINEQSELLEHLKGIVRGSEQVRAAEDEGKLIRLATGDGMALVFRNSPEAPAQCALELSRADKQHPELQLRMGIHSGPINEVTDVNERANVTGAGINMAQRVMDCGDAGHILLSKRVADDLAQYRHWQPLLHELGECEVKHGVRLSVVNLYTDELGNSAVPAKFKAVPKPKTGTRKLLMLAGAAGIVLLVGVLIYSLARKGGLSGSVPDKSIAVLPFENLSDDKSNAYFADGIQDEILTKLSGIADLKVISRSSTAKYKSRPEDLKTVSQQLGVANVLEGTVQRAEGKVRVNVQLIDARADSHLWAKTYDRDIKDVFAVESEVSQEIADALQARLSPNEANTLATAPTRNPEAYDFFLKGEYEEREAESSFKPEAFNQAAAWYREAITHDPYFALAIARLAENGTQRHWFVAPLNQAALNDIKSTAERALALAPNLAEAHVGMGAFYYFGQRRYEEALSEFQRALELQPNNERALDFSASVHRRQGQWERSISEVEKCEQLSPRDATLAANISASYLQLRMWKEAQRDGSRALALDPHNVLGMRTVLLSCLNGTGDISASRRIVATFPPGTLVNKALYGNVSPIIGDVIYLFVIERDFGGALKSWESTQSDPAEERQRLSARAAIHVLAGDAAGAQDEIQKARSLVEARLDEQPDELLALIELSWINLALDRNSDALRRAEEAAALVPPEKDALVGAGVLARLAEAQARAGQPGEAIKTLQRLLAIPAGISVSIERLKIDPVWDPIRNDPGFQQLIGGTQLIGPPK